MHRFLKSIFPVILLLILGSTGYSAQLSGRIFVKNTDGAVYAVASILEVSDQVSLQFSGRKLVSTVSRVAPAQNGSEIVSAIFTKLPEGSNLDALIMRGVVTEDGGVNGDFFVKRFSAVPTTADLNAILERIQTNHTDDLNYESAFSFSSAEPQDAGIERILTGRSRGRLVFARLVYDNKDYSRVVGCWTNAGVGRNAEYYQGECPIQGSYYWEASANGRVMTAAGFERGVPYSWTRAGQLQSLLVGAERTRAFNEVYLNYSRPNFYGWGFFFLFPWQIML
jgi:hypothetical protein